MLSVPGSRTKEVIAFVVVMFVLTLLTAGRSHAAKEWTFMVYMSADNNLEPAGIIDFNEMETIGSDGNVNIVVQFDRIPGYDNSNGDWTTTRRYYVTKDFDQNIINSTLIEDMGELNMGNPNTLVDFVAWAMTDYPADKYILVLWDHGSGWHKKRLSNSFPSITGPYPPRNESLNALPYTSVDKPLVISNNILSSQIPLPTHPPIEMAEGFKYICSDEQDGDGLFNDELQWALSQLPQLDIVGLDACLMNMVETAYEIRGQADYMVSSEDSEQGDGWPYDLILSDLATTPAMSVAKLCSTIVERYGDFCEAISEQDQTQSAIDLSKITSLTNSVDALAQAMIAGSSWPAIIQAAETTEGCTDPFGMHKDLYHFAELISASVSEAGIVSAANAVKAAFDAAVISNYSGSEHPNFHGLAIFLPTDQSEYNDKYADGSNIDFPTDTQWDEFLQQLISGGTAPIDTYEPNNTLSQAYGPLTSDHTYSSYIPYSSDEDWYFISFGATSNISITLDVPSGADFDLYLIDTTGTILAQSIASGDVDEAIDYSLATASIYYIRVAPYSSSSAEPYHLSSTFSGEEMGYSILSYDDNDPEFGVYGTELGDALCLAMTPPTFPVKLEYLFFHFVDLDAAGQGGDGSFYLYLVDYYGYLIEPLDLGLLTPSDTGWNYLDVSSYDIIVNSDFFVGIIYDGFDTPALGYDTSYSGRSFYWLASDTAWNDLGYSLFIRAIVSHLVPTDVEQDLPSGLPSAYVLHQNYPNPFNPSTVIEYSVPRRSQVEITLYNLLGQKLKTLVDKAEPAGNYSAYWNGTDYSGKPVASGVYLYRLKAGDFVETRKMILLK